MANAEAWLTGRGACLLITPPSPSIARGELQYRREGHTHVPHGDVTEPQQGQSNGILAVYVDFSTASLQLEEPRVVNRS